jgi:hypothetical protein
VTRPVTERNITMNRITRSAVAAGSVVLVFSLSACSDDSPTDSGGPPTDASQDEYCGILNDPKYFEGLDENSDEQDYLDAVQEIADDLREVGTPEDISDDAREGFEIQLDAVDNLKAEDIDFEGGEDPLEAELSEDEKDKVEAYSEYEQQTCPDETEPEDPEAS